MSTDLALIEIEITPETAPAVFKGEGLDYFYEKIKAASNEVPDTSTTEGRKRIKSLAATVSRSKTAVEGPGRDYLKKVKELPKKLEKELKDFVDKCDARRDEVRKPVTDWEAEQAAIENKRNADILAEKLRAAAIEHEAWFDSIIAQDWELALLADQIFNRDAEDKRKAAEQAQRERDAALVQEAAAKAKADAEAKAQADKDASDKREREALLAKERAEADLAKAAQDLKDAEAKAKQDKIESDRRAEVAKQKADADKKLAEEASAQRERDKQAADAKRLEDEKAEREANTAHKAKINRAAVAAMIAVGITEEQAKAVLILVLKGKVPNVSINY